MKNMLCFHHDNFHPIKKTYLIKQLYYFIIELFMTGVWYVELEFSIILYRNNHLKFERIYEINMMNFHQPILIEFSMELNILTK